MKHKNSLISALIILFILGTSAFMTNDIAQAEGPVIRAVLFYSPSCPHCHKVITEDLPPLFEKYGDQLTIIGIDVTTQNGQSLYQSAVSTFEIPESRLGVPCLIVGDMVLVGSLEIPQQLPGIIDNGLSSGGIAWPAIPGLATAIENESIPGNNEEQATSGNQETVIPESQASVWQKITRDPAGNFISIVVLLGMLASVTGLGLYAVRSASNRNTHSGKGQKAGFSWPSWIIPFLSIIGLIVAGYLTYVELTLTEAVCGPVGDCNTVQQSPYAYLFGVLPIGVLGLAGYLAIIMTWVIKELNINALRSASILSLWGLAWIGTLFSIYLTFLEPFIIGATCMWCVSSAVIMVLLLWATSGPAIQLLQGSQIQRRRFKNA
jgi:uncharacterized membrane protein/thiol-disulfide isomerase/thioredoxin